MYKRIIGGYLYITLLGLSPPPDKDLALPKISLIDLDINHLWVISNK